MAAPGFASPLAPARFRHPRPHLEDGVPLARLIQGSGLCERTLRRWLARYRADGIAGLERRGRADRGRRRKIAPRIEAMIQAAACQRPRPTLTAIHRWVSAKAAAEGLAAPSYAVVADIARRIEPAVIAAGSADYRDRHELVHRREAAAPNETWQADHTLLDILVIDETALSFPDPDQPDHENRM